MAHAEDFQPEIKFRWCRTVRCRTHIVYLVLTSVTGTQVPLTWRADLGWYESDPTPVPCGFHTGFILVKERVRDFVRDTLETTEADYKVDPFHIVPHKFAVELFLESDEATSFWSEAPDLRLRYLSSDHLEKLGTSSCEELYREVYDEHCFSNRKWVSSTSLHNKPGHHGIETSNLTRSYHDPIGKQSISFGRGKSYGQLTSPTIPGGGLVKYSNNSTSSPNLSKAFQIAVDLSKASSKYLVGVSSTSSGVFLGYDEGSDPPSFGNGNHIHTDSAYAAGGETSQESEAGESTKRRKKSQSFSRGRSLQLEDLVGEESCRHKRGKTSLGLSSGPSSSFEDLFGSLAASRKKAVKSEINLMRFETLKREQLVKEILQPSDSDFEEEEAPCESSNSDIQGPYQCVITLESRSTSMDDVGSPRALEDALVSLTSNDSHPEASQPQPLPRTFMRPDLLSDESNLLSPEHEDDEKRPTPKPRTITPVSVEIERGEKDQFEGVERMSADVGSAMKIPADSSNEEILSTKLQSPRDQDISKENLSTNKNLTVWESEGSTTYFGRTEPRIIISDVEDDNFQYDSLKQDDNEKLPIDIRNMDSEESLEDVNQKIKSDNFHIKKEYMVEETSDSKTEDDESEGGGLYEVEGAEAGYSSIDGEIPTDSVVLVPLDSYKGTVREVKNYGVDMQSDLLGEDSDSGGNVVGVKSDETFITRVADAEDDVIIPGGNSEYLDNVETDRSETEALFNITDVSIKHSIDNEDDNEEVKLIKKEEGDIVKTPKHINGHPKKVHAVREKDWGNIDYREPRKISSGYRESNKMNNDNRILTRSFSDYKQPKLAKESDKSFQRQFSDSSMQKNQYQSRTSDFLRDDQNAENHKPTIRPLLFNTSTQTAAIKQVSRTTSYDFQTFSESDSHSSNGHPPNKYGRSPLRNRTNGQAEPYIPLPDRLSGPWSQRLSTSSSRIRSSISPSPFQNPDLMMLQRNLYNLVQGDELEQNSVLLQRLRNKQHGNISKPQSKQGCFDYNSFKCPSTSKSPLPEHSTSNHTYPHFQSSDHNHHHQPQHHHSPVLFRSQNMPFSTPHQYKNPMLSTSVIKPSSPSRTSFISALASKRNGGAFSGSVTDLRQTTQRTKYDNVSSSVGGPGRVRPASSLPDLRQSSALPRQYTPTPPTYAPVQQGPKHAHSALDIMVGGYNSRGKRVSWREWHVADESDSGDSTDSLIDEAEKATSKLRMDLSHLDWDDSYRKSHRSRRRRSHSHQGFAHSREDSVAYGRSLSVSRPYLPYRGDQLSPGQQVKVLAPGGGVAVARVVTNQRSALVTSKSQRYSSTGMISPAAVTVILLSEPNRLQGTVVTVPLEKVLLAWPST